MDQPISQSIHVGNQICFRTKVRVPKWYLAYFLLAAFVLMTISGILYLNHTIMNIFANSVTVNGEWAGRLTELTKLDILSGGVNAPGNDVFDTRDVSGESTKLRHALIVFTAQFEAMKDELEGNLPPEEAQVLLAQLEVVQARMDDMVQEAQQIFSYIEHGEFDKAGERMATMDRKYFQVDSAIANVGKSFQSFQSARLRNQEAAAESFQKYEDVIALFIVLMVCGASFYGLKIYQQMKMAAEQKEHFLKNLQERTNEVWIARDQALVATKAKSAFLAKMSHEIRTPLSGASGMAELLLNMDLSSSQRKIAQWFHLSTNSLLKIVDDLLDLSKVEAGKLNIEERDFNVGAILEEVKNLFAHSVGQKGITLSCIVSPTIPEYLRGDSSRIRQILVNLIGNAVKFTDQGKVTLSVTLMSETADSVVVRWKVKDTGMGISREFQSRLFQPFSQVNDEIAVKNEGAGLGLSISKQLVELMNGEMGFHSEKGIGSTFWFILNLKKSETSRICETHQPDRLPNKMFSGTHVLVVEDDLVHQEGLSGMLLLLGCTSSIVDNGYKAVKAFQTSHYDLILMDYRLPELSGLEATRKIREKENTQELKEDVRNSNNNSKEEILEPVSDSPSSYHWSRRIPIIGMTASLTSDKSENWRQAGMDEILVKPPTLSGLKKILSRWTSLNGQSSPVPMQRDREVASNQEPLDVTVIEQLKDIGGTEDPQFLPRVISRFLTAVPSCFCKLDKAVEWNDGEALADTAHALENSCRFIGAHRLGDMCTRLEALGREGFISEGVKVLKNLKAEYQEVCKELEMQKVI